MFITHKAKLNQNLSHICQANIIIWLKKVLHLAKYVSPTCSKTKISEFLIFVS